MLSATESNIISGEKLDITAGEFLIFLCLAFQSSILGYTFGPVLAQEQQV